MTLTSVDHALHLLELLNTRADIGVTEASKALSVAPSSAHRLLKTLEMRGFAYRDDDTRRYSIGAKMRPMIDVHTLTAGVRPIITKLGEITGATVHLCLLTGHDMHFVHSWEPATAVRVPSKVGVTIPAHLASSGKILIAGRSDDEIMSEYTSERLGGPTLWSIRSTSALIQELQVAKANGFARNVQESENGVNALAVALQSRPNDLQMSLSVSNTPDRLPLASGLARSTQERRVFSFLTRAAESIDRSFRRLQLGVSA